eukprot:TRINITY_DN10196_c0_g1_i1.p1 TRINITY_DN10196_c0_g1~~TRINITY_DN10196_c0_g1_i1.p1  ORF type:complete len:1466 (+),score=348.26 TRINITY_DN10196_c0_g1_i1:79-4398(+)
MLWRTESSITENPGRVKLPPSVLLRFATDQAELPLEPKETPRLLIAEDNIMQAQGAKVVLERRGIHTTWVRDGQSALQLLEQEVFDAVLVDLDMPAMSGIELTARVRAAEARAGRMARRVVIIGCLAPEHVTPDCVSMCRDAGMDRYLLKPLVCHARLLRRLFTGYDSAAAAFRSRVMRFAWYARYRDICDIFRGVKNGTRDFAPFAPGDERRQLELMAAGDAEDSMELLRIFVRQRKEQQARVGAQFEELIMRTEDAERQMQIMRSAEAEKEKVLDNHDAASPARLRAERELQGRIEELTKSVQQEQEEKARLKGEVRALIAGGTKHSSMVGQLRRTINWMVKHSASLERGVMEHHDEKQEVQFVAAVSPTSPRSKLDKDSMLAQSFFRPELEELLCSIQDAVEQGYPPTATIFRDVLAREQLLWENLANGWSPAQMMRSAQRRGRVQTSKVATQTDDALMLEAMEEGANPEQSKTIAAAGLRTQAQLESVSEMLNELHGSLYPLLQTFAARQGIKLVGVEEEAAGEQVGDAESEPGQTGRRRSVHHTADSAADLHSRMAMLKRNLVRCTEAGAALSNASADFALRSMSAASSRSESSGSEGEGSNSPSPCEDGAGEPDFSASAPTPALPGGRRSRARKTVRRSNTTTIRRDPKRAQQRTSMQFARTYSKGTDKKPEWGSESAANQDEVSPFAQQLTEALDLDLRPGEAAVLTRSDSLQDTADGEEGAGPGAAEEAKKGEPGSGREPDAGQEAKEARRDRKTARQREANEAKEPKERDKASRKEKERELREAAQQAKEAATALATARGLQAATVGQLLAAMRDHKDRMRHAAGVVGITEAEFVMIMEHKGTLAFISAILDPENAPPLPQREQPKALPWNYGAGAKGGPTPPPSRGRGGPPGARGKRKSVQAAAAITGAMHSASMRAGGRGLRELKEHQAEQQKAQESAEAAEGGGGEAAEAAAGGDQSPQHPAHFSPPMQHAVQQEQRMFTGTTTAVHRTETGTSVSQSLPPSQAGAGFHHSDPRASIAALSEGPGWSESDPFVVAAMPHRACRSDEQHDETWDNSRGRRSVVSSAAARSQSGSQWANEEKGLTGSEQTASEQDSADLRPDPPERESSTPSRPAEARSASILDLTSRPVSPPRASPQHAGSQPPQERPRGAHFTPGLIETAERPASPPPPGPPPEGPDPAVATGRAPQPPSPGQRDGPRGAQLHHRHGPPQQVTQRRQRRSEAGAEGTPKDQQLPPLMFDPERSSPGPHSRERSGSVGSRWGPGRRRSDRRRSSGRSAHRKSSGGHRRASNVRPASRQSRGGPQWRGIAATSGPQEDAPALPVLVGAGAAGAGRGRDGGSIALGVGGMHVGPSQSQSSARPASPESRRGSAAGRRQSSFRDGRSQSPTMRPRKGRSVGGRSGLMRGSSYRRTLTDVSQDASRSGDLAS